MELDNRVRELADEMGVSFFGVADLSPAYEFILDQGGPMVAGYPRAICVGIVLSHGIVDRLPQRDQLSVAMTYRHHAYDVVNQRLDHIISRLSGTLQQEGHGALPVPASQTVDEDRLCGLFSHKLAAHLAGLGWIGKSCLLVTPEVGPRVRWATVLTDASLAVTGEPMEERCGSCQQCVESCPPRAFTGEPFREQEPRDVRFVARKCREYQNELQEAMGVSACGMCLYVCPHGRSAAKRES
jgi:epoxyqueuosine reductase